MSLKHPSRIAFFLLPFAFSLFPLTGCAGLRLAPGQEQKQIALDTHMTALKVNSHGAMPAGDDTSRLVAGTRTNLSYIGVPANPVIEDYTATLAKAGADAIKRPDANDIFAAADQGLSLAVQLAILFGFGGAGVGGKKVLDWIALAKQKSKALEEIINGGEMFKQGSTDGEKQSFKNAQDLHQTTATKKLVAEIKLDNS